MLLTNFVGSLYEAKQPDRSGGVADLETIHICDSLRLLSLDIDV